MPAEKKSCLSGRGLTREFGFGGSKTAAVDHVDFDFYEGEIASIVGESGSGKTTLAKMLLGLIRPTGGEIWFQGGKRDIGTRKKKKEYWRNIQAIFQDPFSSFNIFSKIDTVLLEKRHQTGSHGRAAVRASVLADVRAVVPEDDLPRLGSAGQVAGQPVVLRRPRRIRRPERVDGGEMHVGLVERVVELAP
mgnify:CR=1 FL=1